MKINFTHAWSFKEQGFTLIELMVSLTLFSLVVTVSVGTLLTMVNANTKAQAMSVASTNLSFAIDSMTREIRTSYKYYCDSDISDSANLPSGTNDCSNGNYIVFTREWDLKRAGYRLKNGKIEYKEDTARWLPITSDEIEIVSFSLEVGDTASVANGDTGQPYVRLRLKGSIEDSSGSDTSFSIQTLAVSRRIDRI